MQGQTHFGELPYSPIEVKKTGQTPPKEFFWKYIGGFAWGQVCRRDVNSLIAPPCLPAVRVSPCHSRQPSIISDASAAEGDRSSTPSDINSPRHRTHSLCNVRHYVMGGCYVEACFPAVWVLLGRRALGMLQVLCFPK